MRPTPWTAKILTTKILNTQISTTTNRRPRETLFLLPLVSGVSRAHRAQSQGHRLCDGAGSPGQGRRPQQAAGIPRRQSADARAGAGDPWRRAFAAVARYHRISRRNAARAAAVAQGP